MTTTDQPDSTTPIKRAGRPKNENYLKWEDAREAVRAEMIPSRSKYFEWWERNKPKAIPRFPYRVYIEEWISWNDFLGTNNSFKLNSAGKWRSYSEAILWAHALKIPTQEAWMEFARTSGKLPEDIPARPDLAYGKWVSWGHWLGNKPIAAIEAKKEAVQQVAIYYIIRESNAPGNILTYGVDPHGITHLKEWWERDKFEVIKLYWYQPTQQTYIKQVLDRLSTPYRGDDRQRITPNIWEIMWYFDAVLEPVRN